MKKLIILGIFIFVAHSILAQVLSDAEVVARRDASGAIVAEYSKVKDKIVKIPLSHLVENIEVLKLESSDAALVSSTHTIVSKNYILVKAKDNNPYKLFDKKGKFIAKIGSVGTNEGEYKLIYDAQIDEKNKLIYLLPWQTDKLLVFNFEGKPLQPYPLATYVPKGKFRVNDDKTITLAALPFKGNTKYVVWNQTIDGKVLNGIDSEKYAINPDFSNEVFASKNVDSFDFMLFMFWGDNRDWLKYDAKTNELKVFFKMDFGDIKAPISGYDEWPLHYTANFSEPKKLTEYTTTTQNHRFLIVDKKTLKGAYYTLYNDLLGDIPIEWPSIENGYYVSNIDPISLRTMLQKALEDNQNMTSAMKNKLIKLKNAITDNDNNYVVYGKLKQ